MYDHNHKNVTGCNVGGSVGDLLDKVYLVISFLTIVFNSKSYFCTGLTLFKTGWVFLSAQDRQCNNKKNSAA